MATCALGACARGLEVAPRREARSAGGQDVLVEGTVRGSAATARGR